MEQWIEAIAVHVGLVIEAMATIMLAVSSIQAFIGAMRAALIGGTSEEDKRSLWLRYAGALIGAMTFQLAADLASIAVAPNWEQVGQLSVIAVVRTMLSLYLDRATSHLRARMQHLSDQKQT